jgi:hypothetical protein
MPVALHFICKTTEIVAAIYLSFYHKTAYTLCGFVLKHNGLCTYNVMLWGVRVMLIFPRLSKQPNTISIEERFMQIRRAAGALIHTDRPTDKTKLISTFLRLCERA